jgi:hypothetical protein
MCLSHVVSVVVMGVIALSTTAVAADKASEIVISRGTTIVPVQTSDEKLPVAQASGKRSMFIVPRGQLIQLDKARVEQQDGRWLSALTEDGIPGWIRANEKGQEFYVEQSSIVSALLDKKVEGLAYYRRTEPLVTTTTGSKGILKITTGELWLVRKSKGTKLEIVPTKQGAGQKGIDEATLIEVDTSKFRVIKIDESVGNSSFPFNFGLGRLSAEPTSYEKVQHIKAELRKKIRVSNPIVTEKRCNQKMTVTANRNSEQELTLAVDSSAGFKLDIARLLLNLGVQAEARARLTDLAKQAIVRIASVNEEVEQILTIFGANAGGRIDLLRITFDRECEKVMSRWVTKGARANAVWEIELAGHPSWMLKKADLKQRLGADGRVEIECKDGDADFVACLDAYDSVIDVLDRQVVPAWAHNLVLSTIVRVLR